MIYIRKGRLKTYSKEAEEKATDEVYSLVCEVDTLLHHTMVMINMIKMLKITC